MSDTAITTILVALFACIPPTLVALAALMSSRLNTKKADVVIAKVDEVHAASNGHLTAVTAALATANDKITSLEKLVTALGKTSKDEQPAKP